MMTFFFHNHTATNCVYVTFKLTLYTEQGLPFSTIVRMLNIHNSMLCIQIKYRKYSISVMIAKQLNPMNEFQIMMCLRKN